MKKRPLTPLPPEERALIADWIQVHDEEVPSYVKAALEHHERLWEVLGSNRSRLSRLLTQLRLSMGILPSSEKRKSKDPLGPISLKDGQRLNDSPEMLQHHYERANALVKWHRGLANKHLRKAKHIEDKLTNVEDIELSPEELALLDEEQLAFEKRLELGEGRRDPALKSVTETLMTGAQIHMDEEVCHVPVPKASLEGVDVIKTLVEERERFDFSFSMTRLVLQVEKKVVTNADGERRIIAAQTHDYGPPKFQITWEFLVHMVILVVQYGMPMNRLSRMLSSDEKRFTAAFLSRLMTYAAKRFLPIYISLLDSLADADVLVGDDTTTRVLEVQRHFLSTENTHEPSWCAYSTREQAQHSYEKGDTRLSVLLARELGFEFDRRSIPGTKTSFKTTVLSGRSMAEDPQSLIVVYRSHLGGLGNLLDMLLEKRQASNKELTIQSDLSTVNLVANPNLKDKFIFHYAGCASHARRPIAQYEKDDKNICAHMLHLFKGLYIYEHCLDTVGRNAENVAAVRGVDSRKLWQQIKALSEEMTHKWSSKTDLGEGARYIIRNYDKLTAYLEDHRLDISNNFSERMLRMEKLIESSSLFRTSLEGRFALDIMRSVLQTCVAAHVPLQSYLLHVLKTSVKDVEAEPERFAPFAYSQIYHADDDDVLESFNQFMDILKLESGVDPPDDGEEEHTESK